MLVLIYMFVYEWPNRRFAIHHVVAAMLLAGLMLLEGLSPPPLLGIPEWSILLVVTGLIVLQRVEKL
jgi:hypothetical protein